MPAFHEGGAGVIEPLMASAAPPPEPLLLRGPAASAEFPDLRARAVALELAQLGIERDRVRAEARVAGFTRSTAARPARGATIIVLP
jgi:hypothetical protein